MSNAIMYRLGGLLMIGIAALFAWWMIWLPYQEALAGAPEIRLSMKVFILVPVAFVFGLYLLVCGDAYPYRDAEAQKLTLAGWVLMAIVAVASFVGYFGFEQVIESLGYR